MQDQYGGSAAILEPVFDRVAIDSDDTRRRDIAHGQILRAPS
jgi:hypothetical protein